MSLARRLGGATRQHALLELQDALVDVQGVRHYDRMRDALPVNFAERYIGGETCGNELFCKWASAPQSTILGHFVESGQTQAPRSSTRHELRIYIAFGGPRGPPGKVPVGTGGPPVPAGTYPVE